MFGVIYDDEYDEESEGEAVGSAYGVDTGYAGESTTWLLYGWYLMAGGLLSSKLALAFDRDEGGDDGGLSSSNVAFLLNDGIESDWGEGSSSL